MLKIYKMIMILISMIKFKCFTKMKITQITNNHKWNRIFNKLTNLIKNKIKNLATTKNNEKQQQENNK